MAVSGFFEALKIAHLSASTPPLLPPLGRHHSTGCACCTKTDSASLNHPTRCAESRPTCRGPSEAPIISLEPLVQPPLLQCFHYVEPLASSHRDATELPLSFFTNLNPRPPASHSLLRLVLSCSLRFCRAYVSSTLQKSSLIEAFPISSISRTVDRPRVIAH